jgi:FKBP-type peptidyl-prolyl cis-trans isomerase FkpA
MRIKAVAFLLLGWIAVWGCKGGGKQAGTNTDMKKPEASGGEMVITPSGLNYQDLVVGEGEEAQAGDLVSVHYTGWLKDGKKFDSSLDRGTPFPFNLGTGTVIKGWDEGVAGMRVGGKRKLIIPPELGYGNRDIGNGLIPPNSTLIFEVELLRVQKKSQ